jgi:hypothetical protein
LLIAPAAHAWLKRLLAAAEAVTIIERLVCAVIPPDDKFLELAINGHADLIVSGDAICSRSVPFATSQSFRRRSSCKAWRVS